MLSNIDAYRELCSLVSSFLARGFVKITKNNDIITIYSPGGGKRGKMGLGNVFTELPINCNKVCWVTPLRSDKNKKILAKAGAVINQDDCAYYSVTPYWNGSRYRIDTFKSNGKLIKSFKIKLFSINIGDNNNKAKKPSDKDINKDKAKDASPNLLAINGNHVNK